jgi:hypothetical protein
VTTSSRGRLILAGLGGVAVALIVVELALGALSFGEPRLADPCTASAGSSGGGVSGAVERFARATLDGAACRLNTTREELVLSFVPAAGTKRIRWSQQTIDDALKAGFDHAAHTVAGGGIAGGVLSFALTRLVAPSVAWFIQHAG